jgi:putative ABC transport system substrate-binding protein
MIAASLILFASQAEGQQPVHRVGVLSNTENPEAAQAWLEGLRERGYVVGGNLQIEYRYSRVGTELIPALVAELVAFGPEVLVAESTPNAVAVHAAAPTIPLVFVNVGDPVAVGLLESLAHPGGNVTGLANNVPEGFLGKTFQFLKAIVPQASRMAVLVNPTNPIYQRWLRDWRSRSAPRNEQAKLPYTGRQLEVELLPDIGRQLELELFVVEASKADELETAFETAHIQGAEAINLPGDQVSLIHRAKVVELAARYRLPVLYWNPSFVRDGGLISYGPNRLGTWRRAGNYVDKILKGEKPGDLPVQQPTRFDLIVNLKTAAALGITVPPSILAQAEEVIE